ncbi:MAG: ABC transporter ATP-binding protein [Mycobacteriaceae bacterium]|uniref:ABC transporter ATP-binding protein n=1 Tax=Corynebacterium sp. TaxID=1720 RepID=UPI003F96B4EC
MIEVESLTKRYGSATVVDDLNFTVKPGIVTGFLGPNGAGKSTTMRMIVGLDRASAGSATIDGKRYDEYAKPLDKVGTLLDAKWVHPNRSAANHLKWMATANGISHKRVDEVLDLVGLTEVAGKKAGNFSLGMGQRLGLAVALLGDPEVLILDEPVNGLDPEGIRWVRDFVRHLASEGRTVMISSHLLSEMSMTADHLVVIGRGALVADTSTHDFIKNASTATTVVRTDHLAEMKDALTEQDVVFTESTDDEGRPRLVMEDTETDTVGRIAYSYGLLLRELSEQRASLEDAFMRMTGHAVDYHASLGEDMGEVGDLPDLPTDTGGAPPAAPGLKDADIREGEK